MKHGGITEKVIAVALKVHSAQGVQTSCEDPRTALAADLH